MQPREDISMNSHLSTDQVDALLEMLSRALVQIRSAALDCNVARAEAIADAFHNVPHLLSRDDPKRTVDEFRAHFLVPLIARYPDLEWLDTLLP